jgi:hypothetical protein
MQTDRSSLPKFKTLARRQIMLPAEHGAWVFLFTPLLAGLVLGGRLTFASGLLVIAALSAFLVRQPVTIFVKVLSRRRPRSDLGAAGFWLAVYSLAGLLAVAGLLKIGYSFILLLAIPAVPVLIWHLWLVSRRAERHQMVVELAGGAVLALAAPAAFWVGKGQYEPTGWLLWGLTWLQIAGSIIYTYLRLKQRRLNATPEFQDSLRMGELALLFNGGLLILAALLAVLLVVPPWLPAAYAVQVVEVIWGILHPAVRAKPGVIGTRQLVVSLLFTLLFILAWV